MPSPLWILRFIFFFRFLQWLTEHGESALREIESLGEDRNEKEMHFVRGQGIVEKRKTQNEEEEEEEEDNGNNNNSDSSTDENDDPAEEMSKVYNTSQTNADEKEEENVNHSPSPEVKRITVKRKAPKKKEGGPKQPRIQKIAL